MILLTGDSVGLHYTAAADGRLDEERPHDVRPTVEPVDDVRAFALTPQRFTKRVGGLFLFLPDLVRLQLHRLAEHARLPGSRMVPPTHG